MNSEGRRVGTTPPGANRCTTLGNMNASTEEAVANERPAFEAIVLIVLLPIARSKFSVLIGLGLPPSQEDTESPKPAC